MFDTLIHMTCDDMSPHVKHMYQGVEHVYACVCHVESLVSHTSPPHMFVLLHQTLAWNKAPLCVILPSNYSSSQVIVVYILLDQASPNPLVWRPQSILALVGISY
jgi:hypothetical protein